MKKSIKTNRQSDKELTGNPYRIGTLYHELFMMMSGSALTKDQRLIAFKAVSRKMNKPVKACEYAYAVLRSPTHQSNSGSKVVETKDGKVKLVICKKPSKK